ncbi:MAG: hypothetical protein ABJE66_20600 [Deltaproteobacteria bacterium]
MTITTLLAACGGKRPPASAAPRIANALAAALTAAEHTKAPWRCIAADLPEPTATLPKPWKLIGSSLQHDNDKDHELVIGVVADAGGADPKTLAALGRLRAKLDDAHADLVLALGGMGTTQPELEATLGVLAKPSSPVVALPGDLESVAAETAAIAKLGTKNVAVLDGRLVRWIELPDASIALLPGAGSRLRLAAGGDGCAWQADDVLQLYQELAAKPGLRIAALAEAPRDDHGGEPSGEADLAVGPAIDLLVHGPTQPAPSPARSGGRDGTRASVTPGTADAMPRLPETHAPAAGLLTIHGTTWTWKPLVDKS